MDRYIKQLLSADSRVIIPQFGSLQALMEDKVSISFNPYLNFDDGKLAAAVAKAEGVDEDEARKRVSVAVDGYNNTLQDGGTVVLRGIGSFRRDEDGRVEFTQADDDGVAGVADEAATPPRRSEPFGEPPFADESDAGEPGPGPDEGEGGDAPAAEAGGRGKKSRRGLWAVLVILLLLLLSWLLLFVVFKDNAAYRYFYGPAEDEVVRPAPAPPAPVAEQDTIAEPVAPAPAPEPEHSVARPLKKRYNIIVGSYKDEQEAVRRVDDLRAKGFADAFVGIRKNHFVAVLADFSSISEAERAQERAVDGPHHIESWITNSGEYGR